MDEVAEVLSEPGSFMRFTTGLEPTDYQRRYIGDFSKHVIFKSGRQVGKSIGTAAKVSWKSFISTEPELVLIIAPTQRQSGLLFEKITKICHSTPLVESKIERETATLLQFSERDHNGSKIVCLPAGKQGTTIKGFSPTWMVFEEAAFIPDSVYTHLWPSIIATGGDVTYISTPFGKRGRFWEAWAYQNEWSKHSVSCYDCPFISREELDRIRDRTTEMEFRQEYFGEFVEEADTYFPRSLVMSTVSEYEAHVAPRDGWTYYLGVDLARYGLDESVYVIIATRDGTSGTVMSVEATSKKPLTDAMGRIQALNDQWGFRRIFIDESGLGSGAVDVLKERAGDRVEPVTFTLQAKEDMYKNLKLLMERGSLEIPDDRKLILQICELQYEYTSSGHLKLHHPDRGHDDYPDALALACLGITTEDRTGAGGVLEF